MNLFTLNGATINGRAGALVLAAAAAIAASGSVLANASRGTLATAGVSSGAQVTADVSYIPNGRAGLAGQAAILAIPTHIQGANAGMAGTAQVVAFLLREIQASVDVLGTAEIQAIPASVLGSSSVSGAATLVSQATKVQPGRAGLDSVASVTITPAPVVTRYVASRITAGAQGRVETTINGVQEAFAPVAGTVSIALVDTAMARRMAVAQILATTEISPVATKRQPGRADVPAIAAFMNTDPFIAIGADATIAAGSSITANGVRVRTAGAASTGASSVSAAARTRQVAHAAPTGSVSVIASSVRRTPGAAAPVGSGSVRANALRVVRGVSAVRGEAGMFVASGSLTFAQAVFYARCEVDVAEPVFAEQAFASMGGTCTVVNTDVRLAEQGQAAFGGSCSMQLWEARVNAFVAVDMPCAATLMAEAVTLLNASVQAGTGASVLAAPTAVRRAGCVVNASSTSVLANAVRVVVPVAAATCAAQLQATSTDYERMVRAADARTTAAVEAVASYVYRGAGNLTGSVQVLARATDYERILNAANARTSAEVLAALAVTLNGRALPGGSVQVLARATDYERILNAARPTGSAQVTARATDYERLVQGAAVQSSVQILATSRVTRFVRAQPQGTAFVFAAPKTFDRVVDGARVSGTAGMVVGGKLAERGAAAVRAGVTISADATALLSPPAAFVYGRAYITADTIANIASMDPPERTFTRPVYLADFVRPAQETEFRRAA